MAGQKLNFGDEVKAIFLLCSLPSSWDTFCTTISNSVPGGVLRFDDVTSSLLSEKIRRKSMDSKSKSAYSVQSRGRSQTRDKPQGMSKSRSISHARKNVECYHCHKLGHIKKDCYAWKREHKKKKYDDKKDSNIEQTEKTNDQGKIKIEELDANFLESVVADDMHVVESSEDTQHILYASSTLSFDALVANDGVYAQDWMLDSGASYHVTPHREWFLTYRQGHYGSVRLGDSFTCEITGFKNICCQFPNGSLFTLHNVCHVLALTKSLISTGQLDDIGYHTVFGSQSWKIMKGFMVIAKGVKCGSLYPMHVSFVNENVVAITKLPSTSLWHCRLGHISRSGMESLTRFGYLPVLPYSDFPCCEFCDYGKHAKSSYKSLDKKQLQPLELVHSDVCGPMPTRLLGGGLYFSLS